MGKEKVHDIFASIADGYDAANDRISFGMHRFWKQHLVQAAKSTVAETIAAGKAGIILDCCCGTGDITEMIARQNPDILVVGLDFSEDMLDVARYRTKGMRNVMLVEGDAMDLPFDDGTFDSAVISFGLRNTPDYGRVISEMARVTRSGGIVGCLDASVPDDPVVLPFYLIYYKFIMVLLGGGFTKIGEYAWLYESTQKFLKKKELATLFEEVGLRDVDVESFMMGAAAMHVGEVWH